MRMFFLILDGFSCLCGLFHSFIHIRHLSSSGSGILDITLDTLVQYFSYLAIAQLQLLT